ncbi:MAG: S41 family peptidase [Gemmatimonadaceae bacterium]
MNRCRWGYLPLAGLLVMLSPALRAQQTDSVKRPTRSRSLYEDLQLFSGVLNQIRVNHPDTTINTHGLILAAIRGMVQSADPYSAVLVGATFTPERERAMREGKLAPVPIDFVLSNARAGAPVVTSIVPGSQASRQDILRGDELIAISGQPVLAQSEQELYYTLVGEKNTRVKLTFARTRLDGSRLQFDRDIKRERSDDAGESPVPVVVMLDQQTGYARITTFDSRRVADELHDALGKLERQGMKRLVLDIRDNGGGYIDQASDIAGEFLPKGSIVYTYSGRKEEVSRDTGRVSRSFWSREKRYPMVLMVNGGSASASELVAGALQDHDRALIVGHPSHGKALVMQFFPIEDGGSTLSFVYLNIARIRTPCGRIVQREYRGLSRQDYFRQALTDRDTTGRPSCRTDGGRTVYGGGGVYPDVRLPDEIGDPVWLSRLREAGLIETWTTAWVGANGNVYPKLEALVAAPMLPAPALAEFHKFVEGRSIVVPTGEDADRLLQRELVQQIALTKWGIQGKYYLMALMDPEVKAGVAAFDRAQAILAVSK